MNDDQMMDRLLTDAMAAKAPELSPAFDERVMQRVRPRRLTPMGVAVIVVYAVVAAAATVWVMRDVPAALMIAGIAIGVAVAASASAYARHLALG
jgi:hypothetical protein